MIPVGTLCIVVGTVRRWVDGRLLPPKRNGQVCVIVENGHVSPSGYSAAAVEFADGEQEICAYRCLRPIAPPGDPDAVPHDVSEPELAFR